MNTIKKRNQNHLYLSLLSSGLFMLAIATGCQKEYIDRYNTIAADTIKISGKNHIEEFLVKEWSADTLIKASIVDDSIIVYWPLYKTLPETITPEIVLPDSASISPASGTAIAFETGTKYTVTSAAGTTKDYFLSVKFQQYPVIFYGVNNIGVVNTSTLWYMQAATTYIFTGRYFLTETGFNKLTITSASNPNETYDIDILSMTSTSFSFTTPNDLLSGQSYILKFTNGVYSVENEFVIYTPPTIDATSLPSAIKIGEEFSITGTNLTNFVTKAEIRFTTTYYELEVVNNESDNTLVLKAPTGTPTGSANRIRITFKNGTIPTASKTMTVTE